VPSKGRDADRGEPDGERVVNAVTLDDVRAATGTNMSQLDKHFPAGKPELVRAVVALRAEQVLVREEQRLARLKYMSRLRRWRDGLVQGAALQGGACGCALGNMAVELSDQDEQARASLSEHFATWEGLLAAGFRRMQDDGILSATADPDALATELMAACRAATCWRRPIMMSPRWPPHSIWRWSTSKA
jgi:TetR/AcrR family transcriptional regulator, transcriptional repressor for nem operon